MKKILLVLILVFISISALAQNRQVGVTVYNIQNDRRLEIENNFGVNFEGVLPLGEYATVVAKGFFDRYGYEGDKGRNRGIDADGRYRLLETPLFASVGLRYRHSVLASSTENFLSPQVGAGLNFRNRVVGQYQYRIADQTSGLRERGHILKADAYVPLGTTNWLGRAGIEYSRISVGNGSCPNYLSACTFNGIEIRAGVARRF